MINMKHFALIGALVVGTILLVSAGKKPVTMFMVGDSTMADKTELDISPERGWGQLLPTYLQGNIVVQNHAMNGRSTKSFLKEGRWDEVMKRAHKGDIVVIQFGHNDSKKTDSTRYASIADYTDNLMKMVQQAQKKKMHVILCTPVSRRYFKNGVFHPRHGGYPDAAKHVASATGVIMVDMEQLTSEWLIGLGDEASKSHFMNVAPGECTKFPDGKIDNTHYRESGALITAAMFVRALNKMNVPWVQPYLHYTENAEPVYSTFCRPNL